MSHLGARPVERTFASAMVGKRPHHDLEPCATVATAVATAAVPALDSHPYKRPRRFSTPDSATSTVTVDQGCSVSPSHYRFVHCNRPPPPPPPPPPVYSPNLHCDHYLVQQPHHPSPIPSAPTHAANQYCVDRTPQYTHQSVSPLFSPTPPLELPPPQQPLRSDADVEADIINSFATGDTGAINWTNEMLISVLTTDIEDLCYVNEENSDHVVKAEHKIFFSQYRQPFELEFYIRRLVQYSNCSASAFVTALVYLDRVQERCKALSMSEMNCHRLICTALVLAIKYLDDEVYSNVYYARVGGLSTEELNSLEATMLDVLGWNLTVCPETYGMYEDSLMQSASLLNSS